MVGRVLAALGVVREYRWRGWVGGPVSDFSLTVMMLVSVPGQAEVPATGPARWQSPCRHRAGRLCLISPAGERSSAHPRETDGGGRGVSPGWGLTVACHTFDRGQ